MTSGICLSLNQSASLGAIVLCILFYAPRKSLIYLFLGQCSCLRLYGRFPRLVCHRLSRCYHVRPPRLRRLARRTLAAGAVAPVTSLLNILMLTVMHAQQLGWICLGFCSRDWPINALALFFLTG